MIEVLKTFVCPNCGSGKRIIDGIKDEEVASGKVDKELVVGSAVRHLAVFDPKKASGLLRCPVIVIVQDICAECGTEYICYIGKTEGRPQIGPPPGMPPGQGINLPPGFPMGRG